MKLYAYAGNLPTISSIETVNFYSPTADINLSTSSDVTSVAVESYAMATAALGITLASTQALSLTSITDNGAGGNDINLEHVAGVTALNVTMNGVGNTTANVGCRCFRYSSYYIKM